MAKSKEFRQFEFDRSKNAAHAANENSRVMAQAAMLINGGAATAVIALLSKDKIDPTFLRAIPSSLWGYAFGALFAWAGMFMMTECLDLFNKMWHERATKAPATQLWWTTFLGFASWWAYRGFYILSAACFIYASIKLATALSTATSILPICTDYGA